MLFQFMFVSTLLVTFLTLLAVDSHVHRRVLFETLFEPKLVATFFAWA